MEQITRKVIIGVGGWEHDVLDTCFYPGTGMDSLEKLAFYARHLGSTEVRPTFWDESLTARDARAWSEAATRERRGFLFLPKIHRAITHARSLPSSLVRTQRALFRELQMRGTLGSVLVQFPYAFTSTGAHRFHLESIARAFAGLPLSIEFRHESWNQPSTFSLLAENGLGIVNADLPRLSLYMPFHTRTCGRTAVMRLHGRNERGWMTRAAEARYDYLYNAKELLEIRRRISALPTDIERVLVSFNNTTGGKAIANALQLQAALTGTGIAVPQGSIRAFPHLNSIAVPTAAPSLFAAEAYRSAS